MTKEDQTENLTILVSVTSWQNNFSLLLRLAHINKIERNDIMNELQASLEKSLECKKNVTSFLPIRTKWLQTIEYCSNFCLEAMYRIRRCLRKNCNQNIPRKWVNKHLHLLGKHDREQPKNTRFHHVNNPERVSKKKHLFGRTEVCDAPSKRKIV